MISVVNMIPQSLSGESHQDSEPNLAVNPANPQQMAASAFTQDPLGGPTAPIFVSTDGGTTWHLNSIVPSAVQTLDITLRFSNTSNILYAGIIPTPSWPPPPDLVPGVDILSTDDYLSPTTMSVLFNRQGQGVDQPYIQVATVPGGAGASQDAVYVGNNDFNEPGQRTATIDLSVSAAVPSPQFQPIDIEARTLPSTGQDAPSIRPAIHTDGTVYAAFLHEVSAFGFLIHYDVIVVRDDSWGTSANPFTALTDPGDGQAGVRVAQDRVIPFLPAPGQPGPLGQERIGSHLSIAVDPADSATVYVAWADRVGTTDYTLHVLRSTDRGVTWSQNDLLTLTNALNPALAINSNKEVGFLCQQLVGKSGGARWVTHLQRTSNGADWNDLVLATVPADSPPAQGLPYLGDYVHLMAIGTDFYGVFSANNTPDLANFPNGVTYQRNADFTNHVLLDIDGATPVPISIDPFFFKVTV